MPKLTPLEEFQNTWPTRSPERQLLSLLAAVVGREPGGKVELDIETVLDIDPGQAVVLAIEGEKIVLRYSPIQTLTYAIQDRGTWRNETPASQASRSGIMTDSQLADREDDLIQATQIRKDLVEKAEGLRSGTTPLTGAVQFRKTARTSQQ
jgi:hypothetical protein